MIPEGGEVVFAPAHPCAHGGKKDVVFETRPLPDGRKLGIVFTSLDSLVTTLGVHQPWVALPLKNLCEVFGAQGVGLILFDPVIPDEGWRWTSERLDTLTGAG